MLPTRASALLILLLVSGALAGAADRAAADEAFLAAHRAGLAMNQPRGFEIRFKGGKSTFNPREPIDNRR